MTARYPLVLDANGRISELPSGDTLAGVSGGSSPGGTAGQVQYNDSGALGGFTVSGDGTLNTATGALTVTKTSGTSFGYFATGTDAANLTGTLSVNRFNSGSGASGTTFLAGDGTWKTVTGSGGGGGQHEYEAYGSLDASSGMTAVHVSNVTLTQGTLSIRADWTASASNTVQYYYEAAPGSTPWDVYMRVTSLVYGANDQFGLVVANSSTGKFALFARNFSSAALTVQEWTSATTFSSTLISKSFPTGQIPQWLRINSDGTTLTFYYSFDGSLWISAGTRTIATVLGSLNAIGYGGVPVNAGEAWISNFGTTTPS